MELIEEINERYENYNTESDVLKQPLQDIQSLIAVVKTKHESLQQIQRSINNVFRKLDMQNDDHKVVASELFYILHLLEQAGVE